MKKVNNIKKYWLWLVRSSANPQALSLTVKGIIVMVLPKAVDFLVALGVNISNTQATAQLDKAMMIFTVTVELIGALITIFGLRRKVNKTLE